MYDVFIPTRANQFIHVQKTLNVLVTKFGNEKIKASTPPKRNTVNHQKVDLEGKELGLLPSSALKHTRFFVHEYKYRLVSTTLACSSHNSLEY